MRAFLPTLGCHVRASACVAVIVAQSAIAADRAAPAAPPNILVIVLDDIGIDQAGIAPFGWNASELTPQMPVLESIAQNGVSFTNFWSTPECSPARAALLTGRYGFRTGVVTAIIDPMLPVDQLNPAEITLPKLLGPAGYRTAMLGKYHLGGGATNSPPGYGFEAPASSAGLDFYDGYWDLPPSIDSTIGGQVPAGTYDCGGMGGLGVVGGACFADGSCIEGIAPFEAMALGATPLLDARGSLARSCSDGVCAAIDFDKTNAYYVWHRVITQANGTYVAPTVPQREYLTSFISRRAKEWITEPAGDRRGGRAPWLAFVTHSSAHTPIQPPPPSLSTPRIEEPDCALGSLVGDYRLQFKRMCESVDRSMGEMLVDLGLATERDGVVTLVDPKQTNTMIVVFGDNGSLESTVLPPFDPELSKQTVYQTGVWTPCVVAGPMVNSPGRAVDDMVNVVDLFGLIADAADVDWRSEIPRYRTVDSEPMLPYLTDPRAKGIRQFNFAVYEGGTFAPGQVGPCIISTEVIDGLFTTPQLCTDNGGCWAGGSDTPPYRVTDFCDLMALGTFQCGDTTYCINAANPFCDPPCSDGTCVTPPTTGEWAVRSGPWKLIALTYPSCLAPNDCKLQFFKMATPVPPLEPGLDIPGSPAEIDIGSMTPEEQAMFDVLRTKLFETLSSEWYCPGDGNKDFRVDAADLAGLIGSWGSAGFWDINEDGLTNAVDLAELLGDWNADCTGQLNPSGQNIPSCLQPAG